MGVCKILKSILFVSEAVEKKRSGIDLRSQAENVPILRSKHRDKLRGKNWSFAILSILNKLL